jgi:hypothetical protein
VPIVASVSSVGQHKAGLIPWSRHQGRRQPMPRERTGASSSFDELASGLASGTLSRGKAIRLMGAALLGGTLGSLGGVAAADAPGCKRTGKNCTKDSLCCSGNCVNGRCSCPSGRVLLSNGTCALPCSFGGCAGGCSCLPGVSSPAGYCTTGSGTNTFCPGGDFDCLSGEFCAIHGTCVTAC